MLNRLAIIAALLVGLAIGAGPATAITDGDLDGNGHPYVGLMVAQDANGRPLWRCSGTLLSSRLFVTAGHCTESPAAHVEIWFAADVDAGRPGNGYPYKGDVGGTPYTHPDYNPNRFYVRDLGVVVLDRAYKAGRYGALPKLDQLDALKPSADTIFTAVGYGLQESFPDAASCQENNRRGWSHTRTSCRSTPASPVTSRSCSRTTRTPVAPASATPVVLTLSVTPT